jgi:hypothetical protein
MKKIVLNKKISNVEDVTWREVIHVSCPNVYNYVLQITYPDTIFHIKPFIDMELNK